MIVVYVLLPPSETKVRTGTGPAFDVDGLGFPALAAERRTLLAAVAALSADREAARRALKTSARLDEEVRANALLRAAPTLPALRRYSGVLYGALHTPTISPAEWSRAADRVLITSALFGLLRADDRIPAYRLSAGSALPGLPGIAAFWRPALTVAFAGLDRPVIDLRSGSYASFAAVPGAIKVRVVTRGPSGVVTAVSHDNKAVKGRLARLLATSRAELVDLPDILRLGYRAGWRLKRTGPLSVDVYA